MEIATVVEGLLKLKNGLPAPPENISFESVDQIVFCFWFYVMEGYSNFDEELNDSILTASPLRPKANREPVEWTRCIELATYAFLVCSMDREKTLLLLTQKTHPHSKLAIVEVMEQHGYCIDTEEDVFYL